MGLGAESPGMVDADLALNSCSFQHSITWEHSLLSGPQFPCLSNVTDHTVSSRNLGQQPGVGSQGSKGSLERA